jgi:hypothetical protein
VTRLPFLAAAAALSLLAGCATTPPPPKPAGPVPPPTPAPPPPPPQGDWRDLPLSPGTWSYGAAATGSRARFGQGEKTALTIRCDKPTRTIRFEPAGARPGALVITTSYASRTLPLTASGAGAGAAASLPASDPFLDRIAFSRGRVSYAAGTELPLLMTPAWAEPARVIEDCRS